jgi:hypothetical protein
MFPQGLVPFPEIVLTLSQNIRGIWTKLLEIHENVCSVGCNKKSKAIPVTGLGGL